MNLLCQFKTNADKKKKCLSTGIHYQVFETVSKIQNRLYKLE